jgi:hypothetical protein
MTDYAMFYKSPDPAFSMENPRPHARSKTACFKIVLFNARAKISVPLDASLEDLYIKIYNAVYPEFSTENPHDSIPPVNTLTYVPRIYNVSMVTATEEIVPIPIHRFITLSSFMQANRNCFCEKPMFGSPVYRIFVLNEESMNLVKSGATQTKSHSSYLQKYLGCYTQPVA